MSKNKKLKNNCKLIYIVLGTIVIVLVAVVLYSGFTASSMSRIYRFASNIKNLPNDSSHLYISTSTNDYDRGYDNNYVVDINSGEYYSIKESTHVSANEEVTSTNVLGTYNGYIYIYVSTEGIAKIKNGIPSMVVSKSNIDRVSMELNRLIYEDCDWFGMCRETHLVNLDNEVDKMILQSKSDKDRYVSNIKLYKSGYFTTNLNSIIRVYDKNGDSIDTKSESLMSISFVDDNYMYFIDGSSKASTMVTKYDFRKKTESQITISDYYGYIYNIKTDTLTDGQKLVDLVNYRANTDSDLDTLGTANDNDLFFVSKDELKVFKVNKKSGVKVKIFDCSANNEKIMDVIRI